MNVAWYNKQADNSSSGFPRHIHKESTTSCPINNQGIDQLGCRHDANEVARGQQKIAVHKENQPQRS